MVNYRKISKNYVWASGGCSILSEFGTLSLEFDYLSDLTGNQIYSQKVRFLNIFFTISSTIFFIQDSKNKSSS